VAQVKKASVRVAILESALRLFSERGYSASTLAQIAAGADVSTANFYVYFRSKLDIVFAIYGPWLRQRLEQLELEVAPIEQPRERLRRVVQALWRDIPAEHGGFAKNLMQALSTATVEDGYDSSLLEWAEARIAGLIAAPLAASGRAPLDAAAIAHVMFMTFDGFAVNLRLNPKSACDDRIIDAFCDLLLPRPSSPSEPSPPAEARARSSVKLAEDS
jgi:AcrR family transcriptional regulator